MTKKLFEIPTLNETVNFKSLSFVCFISGRNLMRRWSTTTFRINFSKFSKRNQIFFSCAKLAYAFVLSWIEVWSIPTLRSRVLKKRAWSEGEGGAHYFYFYSLTLCQTFEMAIGQLGKSSSLILTSGQQSEISSYDLINKKYS